MWIRVSRLHLSCPASRAAFDQALTSSYPRDPFGLWSSFQLESQLSPMLRCTRLRHRLHLALSMVDSAIRSRARTLDQQQLQRNQLGSVAHNTKLTETRWNRNSFDFHVGILLFYSLTSVGWGKLLWDAGRVKLNYNKQGWVLPRSPAALQTPTMPVRWAEDGKVWFLHCRLCHSGIGVTDTHNTSVVGTMT